MSRMQYAMDTSKPENAEIAFYKGRGTKSFGRAYNSLFYIILIPWSSGLLIRGFYASIYLALSFEMAKDEIITSIKFAQN